MKTLLCLLMAFLCCLEARSQHLLDQPLRDVREEPLTVFLQRLEDTSGVRVFYLDAWLAPYQVSPSFNGETLRGVLDRLLADSEISYVFLFDYALIFARDPSQAMQREAIVRRAMVERKTIERHAFGDPNRFDPAKRVTVQGTVRDQDTGRPLRDVQVQVNQQAARLVHNAAFSFSLPPDAYVLTISHPGYDDKLIELALYGDGTLEVSLQETPVLLEEVVVSDQSLLDRSIGRGQISMQQLRRLPVFLGEADVIKQVQAQPGVTTVGELASGFNVRGGSVDQNLVLYDDVPIFNTSHALGFFSAFNADNIRDVSFYRGGIPARYGGRVSSVLDISSREGDYTRWRGGGGLGIISSYVSLGGPLKADTTSIQLSARSTYSNWMLRAVQSEYQDLRNTAVNFYDGSLKIAHRTRNDGKLTFSAYASGDQFRLTGDTTFHWYNNAVALRYDWRVNKALLARATVSAGRYEFKVTDRNPANAFSLRYGMLYPSAKFDFEREGRHHLTFGLHHTWYRFAPGRLEPQTPAPTTETIAMATEQSLETGLYISDRFQVSEVLSVEAGVRLSLYNRLGPSTVWQYAQDKPRETYYITDSVAYGAGDIAKTWWVVEPRLSLHIAVAENASMKVGYHRAAQFLHLITNTAAMTPMDIWQMSNTHFRPQVADQLSAGVYGTLRESWIEAFVEGYYKRTRNTLDFKDGADLILNPYLETALVNMEDEAYGVEFSLSRSVGRLQGSANYTWSRVFRRSTGRFEAEQVNEGRRYPANYDQPHVVQLSWRYGISRRIFFSGTFVYRTGRPVSMPASAYVVDGVPVSVFSHRNQFRIPDYHRLDIAFVIEGNHKRKKLLDGNWIFSFYNVYMRKNAYSVYFVPDDNGFLKPYKLAVIGTVVPSITYSFTF